MLTILTRHTNENSCMESTVIVLSDGDEMETRHLCPLEIIQSIKVCLRFRFKEVADVTTELLV